MFTYTRAELITYRAVCEGKSSTRTLSSSLGISERQVYRTVERLRSKGLVLPKRAKAEAILPAQGSHAQALRDFLLSGQAPIEVILGGRLLVLLSIMTAPKDLERVSYETLIGPSSVRVYVWQLKGLGVVLDTSEGLRISPTDHLMIRFLDDFSKGVCRAEMEQIAPQGVLRWSSGLEFLFSSGSTVGETRETGTTAMSAFGLKFFSNTRCFHWAYWHPRLGVEEIAIHNILIEPDNPRIVAYSLLLLHGVDFDRARLIKEAKYRGLENFARKMLDVLDGGEYPGELLPTQDELRELFAQYEGDHASALRQG